MNREQKAAVIEEVASQIKEAQAIFAVDYRGLSVKQAADLRSRLIEIDASLRVVKNTLTERAADQVGADSLKQFLNGPTAFTFVNGDPVLAAKAIAAFRRESQLPEFKGGWMDGKELTIAEIEALPKLPSLDVMHGQLVGLIANPLSGLARCPGPAETAPGPGPDFERAALGHRDRARPDPGAGPRDRRSTAGSGSG